MPEGDTVFLAATRLHRTLGGLELTHTDFRVPRYATLDLSGRGVCEVTSAGKHILFRLSEDVTIHTHFKMEGAWDLYRTGERWRSPGSEARLVLRTSRWVAVGFRLPVIDVLSTLREDDVIGHLGPDPLRSWDVQEALRRLRSAGSRPVGEALLDQSLIAGLGNVYKSEICFLRGLHPDTSVDAVEHLEAVVILAARLLNANRTTGRQITTGDARRGRTSWVYGRGGQPCRRCGSPIQKTQQPSYGMERVTYWCPSCQPAAGRARRGGSGLTSG